MTAEYQLTKVKTPEQGVLNGPKARYFAQPLAVPELGAPSRGLTRRGFTTELIAVGGLAGREPEFVRVQDLRF
jgi:hypothetical protein